MSTFHDPVALQLTLSARRFVDTGASVDSNELQVLRIRYNLDLTSGTSSLYWNWKGKKVELVNPARNSAG